MAPTVRSLQTTCCTDREEKIRPHVETGSSASSSSIILPSMFLRRIIKISLPGDILRDDIEARKIDPSKPMIALTYDDGPGEHTDRLLKLFERVGGACTLFQLGVNIENKDPDHKILKKAVSTGMELASHSYNHPNLLTLSKKKDKNGFAWLNTETRAATH